MAALNPDVIYAATYFPEGGLIAKAMHDQNVSARCEDRTLDLPVQKIEPVETAPLPRSLSPDQKARAQGRIPLLSVADPIDQNRGGFYQSVGLCFGGGLTSAIGRERPGINRPICGRPRLLFLFEEPHQVAIGARLREPGEDDRLGERLLGLFQLACISLEPA